MIRMHNNAVKLQADWRIPSPMTTDLRTNVPSDVTYSYSYSSHVPVTLRSPDYFSSDRTQAFVTSKNSACHCQLAKVSLAAPRRLALLVLASNSEQAQVSKKSNRLVRADLLANKYAQFVRNDMRQRASAKTKNNFLCSEPCNFR